MHFKYSCTKLAVGDASRQLKISNKLGCVLYKIIIICSESRMASTSIWAL